MHAFRTNKGGGYSAGAKIASPARAKKVPSTSSGRVVPLTGTITLTEKDFDKFEKNMKSDVPPTPAALRAALLYQTFKATLEG